MTADAELVARLLAGDQAAFAGLVRAEQGRLLRLARGFCRGNRATAEEVVQDVWLAVLTGLDRYDGSSPLRAWITGIVVNKARTRATRDGRMLAFSDFAQAELGGEAGPEIDPSRFDADGHWTQAVAEWDAVTPERQAGDRQLLHHLAAALETLPPAQRIVVTLRDIEGQDGADVCRLLDLTEGNMRVLLHRGRTRLRAALEAAMQPARVTPGPAGGTRGKTGAPSRRAEP